MLREERIETAFEVCISRCSKTKAVTLGILAWPALSLLLLVGKRDRRTKEAVRAQIHFYSMMVSMDTNSAYPRVLEVESAEDLALARTFE
jgi:hypothetical protein